MPLTSWTRWGRNRTPAKDAATPGIDPLRRFKEGAKDADGRPIPLASTAIVVALRGLLATVTTTRLFRNAEDRSIEATLTWPVPVDAVVHGLKVRIDNRELIGVAEAKAAARVAYENALDTGRTAILHEEALKGVHVLSVGQIPPGGEVTVETVWSMPLSCQKQAPSLRIPTTVGDIYGRSPLDPADDFLVAGIPVPLASLRIEPVRGSAHLRGDVLADGATVVALNRPIDLTFTGLAADPVEGRLADGRAVTIALGPAAAGGDLRLAILVDRSGSTGGPIEGGRRRLSVLDASRLALRDALAEVATPGDRFILWQFDDTVERLGEGGRKEALALLDKVGGPAGGTEIGLAVAQAATDPSITDLLVVTDGRSFSLPVHDLASCGKRVSAVLIGENSLDAMIGHLCALTGGQIIVACGANAVEAAKAAFLAARREASPPRDRCVDVIPSSFVETRGGTRIAVEVSGARAPAEAAGRPLDPVGAYAAALALPRLTEAVAAAVALAHGLVTHLTSLIVIDVEGGVQQGVPDQRKVVLPRPSTDMAAAAPPAMARARAPQSPAPDFMAAMPCPAAPAAGANDRGPSHPCGTGGARDKLAPCLRLIDWDGNASRLSVGDIEGLPAEIRDEISRAASLPIVTAFARTHGLDARLVVIAILARSARKTSRGAARIARRIFAGIDDASLEPIAAALGL